METSCTQLTTLFYVANKSRESETSAYYNLCAFVCHFIFQSIDLLKTTQTNILQYAIYRYSLLAILYCIAVVNIATYQYFDISIVSHTPTMYVYISFNKLIMGSLA